MLKRKIEIILVLLALIGLGLSYIFLHTVESYKFDNDCRYFVNGIEYEIPAGTSAEINDDGYLTINIDEFEIDVNSLPVYELDYPKIILTSNMAYYKPSFDGKFTKTKLTQLTEIEYDYSLLSSIITKGSNSAYETNGVIYDGHNTYVFLESTVLTFNNKTVNLSPLSYVIVENDTWVQAYDQSTNTYYYEETNGSVVANCKNSSYSINLGTDIINYYNIETVMGSGFTMLKDYFKEETE